MSTFTSMLRAPGRSPGSARPRRIPARAAIYSTAVALVASAGLALAAPAHATGGQVLLGSAGDVAAMEQGTHEHMASHTYSDFTRTVPTADMITVGAGSAPWRQVAAAGSGSALYSNIVRWAQTIKGRSGTVLVAYQHEPEASTSTSLGTSADFIAAYRHVVSIFRAQGVRNVKYVWQMTSYSFRTASSDKRYAAKWYPGDAYVDVVGGDGYSWGNCGGSWVSFASFTDPVVKWARSHGKQASMPEFGAAPDSRRAAWLKDAHTYMAANSGTLSSVFYFNRADTVRAGGCGFALKTSAEYSAYGDMARDATHFRS